MIGLFSLWKLAQRRPSIRREMCPISDDGNFVDGQSTGRQLRSPLNAFRPIQRNRHSHVAH